MSPRRSSHAGWGPSHQTGRRRWGRRPRWFWLPIEIALAAWLLGLVRGDDAVVLVTAWALAGSAVRWWHASGRPKATGAWAARSAKDPLAAVRAEMARRGGGILLGRGQSGGWRLARAERAVMVLGPPRSGKTSAVLVPALLAHPGAAVSTSTKPDVLRATIAERAGLGQVWEFDPTGHSDAGQARALRWSPVAASGSWDGALLQARALTGGAGVGAGTTDATHWSKRASALLAALLHAAALDGAGMERVLDWVLRHELDQPGSILERRAAKLACGLLVGLQNTEARERSSICSAAADALDGYTSHRALAGAAAPNFDAERFVHSQATVYVHAPAEDQQLAAPLICGLLSEIRRAAYHAHRHAPSENRILMALDEAANIAPLPELPAIASEGGGQGLNLIAVFQDLSQARSRWGTAADGFLTLFGSKLILPGVADTKTLESVSVALGEYDRRMVSTSRHPQPGAWLPSTGRTVSTQRQRILSPGEVANVPAGHALHLDGLRWELLRLTPAHHVEPWRSLTHQPPQTRRPGNQRAGVQR